MFVISGIGVLKYCLFFVSSKFPVSHSNSIIRMPKPFFSHSWGYSDFLGQGKGGPVDNSYEPIYLYAIYYNSCRKNVNKSNPFGVSSTVVAF